MYRELLHRTMQGGDKQYLYNNILYLGIKESVLVLLALSKRRCLDCCPLAVRNGPVMAPRSKSQFPDAVTLHLCNRRNWVVRNLIFGSVAPTRRCRGGRRTGPAREREEGVGDREIFHGTLLDRFRCRSRELHTFLFTWMR